MAFWLLLTGVAFAVLFLLPLAIKWELEKKIVIPAIILITLISTLLVYITPVTRSAHSLYPFLLQCMVMLLLSISLLLWRFYRDPERNPPEEDNTVLSPADGTVLYVKRINNGEIPLTHKKGNSISLPELFHSDVVPEGGYLIGIAMTYLDVHVNRAPTSGSVEYVKHIRGSFVSLKRQDAVIQNERASIVLDAGTFKLGIVLIASRLVRRVVTYIHEGQQVERGQRIGMIRFGSQVDLALPDLPALRIQVSPGEKVRAGLTILARF